jgi:hypothetical protein
MDGSIGSAAVCGIVAATGLKMATRERSTAASCRSCGMCRVTPDDREGSRT